jgi:ankyrin repeat protein
MFTVRSFLKAAERGDTNAVKNYLSGREAQDCIKGTDGEKNTALHLAAKGGYVEMMQVLIDAGCDLAAKNDKGFTPLVAAVVQGTPASIPVLVKAGADVNVDVPSWDTPLKIAASRYDHAIANLLLDAGADPKKGEPLKAALERRGWELAERLIRAGADANIDTGYKYRALHLAAQNGAVGVLKAALEKGADIDAREHNGNTALHIAIDQGDEKIVRILLEHNARIDISNNYAVDALGAARKRNAPEILELIEPLARAAVAKRTNALNASAEALPEGNADAWVLMGEQTVAHVSVTPALARRITEIFNFESRERYIISENLKTQAENVTTPVSFDATPEKALQRALDALRDLGGQADDEDVFITRMPKKTLKPGS